MKWEIQLHQHQIPQVERKLKFDIRFYWKKEEWCLPKGCYLIANDDHDDEDFEEEPIKLWSWVYVYERQIILICIRNKECV